MNWFEEIDIKILLAINGLRNSRLDPIFLVITQFGQPVYWLLVMLLLFFFNNSQKENRKRIFYLRFLIFMSVIISNITLKFLILRPRPNITHVYGPSETSPSFPSGHSSTAWAGAVSINFTLNHYEKENKWMYLLKLSNYLIATLVSFSRVYIGVHYPSDVLAGALEAIILSKIIIYSYYLTTNDDSLISNFERKKIDQSMFLILQLPKFIEKHLKRAKYISHFSNERINKEITSIRHKVSKNMILKNPFKLFFVSTSILLILSGLITLTAFLSFHFKASIREILMIFYSAGEDACEDLNETINSFFAFSLLILYTGYYFVSMIFNALFSKGLD